MMKSMKETDIHDDYRLDTFQEQRVMYISEEEYAHVKRNHHKEGQRFGQMVCNMFLPEGESFPELFYSDHGNGYPHVSILSEEEIEMMEGE